MTADRNRQRTNENGLTFREWYLAATVYEEGELEPLREEMDLRYRLWKSSRLLGAEPEDIRVVGVRYEAREHSVHVVDIAERARLSKGLARKAWRAGYDPADFAAAPRPLPPDFCRELRGGGNRSTRKHTREAVA